MTSRRMFLRMASAALVAAPFNSRFALAAEPQSEITGKSGMIVRSERFLDLEMPPEYATGWITPVQHFFVRNHMAEPSTLELASWKLTISGEVEKPQTLTFADLARLQSHEVVNTLECAGNGRGLQQPHVPGIQWGRGAVGNARFAGPRLADVLRLAGVKSSGKHVAFVGLDEVPGKVPPFIRSIPIEKATDTDTLVATRMNGATLPKHHGFPARALVPGWIGAASCKWLTEIKVLDKEFPGNFMNPGYRYPNTPGKPGEAVKPEDTHPLTALRVKSLIATPSAGTSLKRAATLIQGAAWAGEAEIVKVEVSVDGGANWQPATLGKDQAKYAWRLWSYHWTPRSAGQHTLLSRATDSQGRTQPEMAEWNPSGYLYNAADQVDVHVV
ncbi:MAG: sulfite oxidase [Acidobacteriales bacterium]|nr:sulfite oxidase [Terriglobales bacterium]